VTLIKVAGYVDHIHVVNPAGSYAAQKRLLVFVAAFAGMTESLTVWHYALGAFFCFRHQSNRNQ
jgi:hypothetical protein